jgi:hypothetical protein
MIKTQIGLGVLSIPAVLDTFGMVPGVILLLIIAVITTWSDYIVGVFKLNHRSVYGIDDVGQLLFGRVGREFFGVVFVLCKWICWHMCDPRTNAYSLDICCWCWYAGHLHRPERRLDTRSMHCYFCGGGRCPWVHAR